MTSFPGRDSAIGKFIKHCAPVDDNTDEIIFISRVLTDSENQGSQGNVRENQMHQVNHGNVSES